MNAERVARALAVGALSAAGCASVIGVPDGRDAVSLLCQCTPGPFGTPEACSRELSARLASGSETDVAAWLAKAKGCIDRCSDAAICFQTPPACVGESFACTSDLECCAGTSCRGALADAGEGATCRP